MILQMDPSGLIAIGTSAVELLQEIFNIIMAIGKTKPLSPVGPCAPMNQGDFWQALVVPELTKLQSITGTIGGG